MIANQFNSASGEIYVNLHSQDHDFGIFQQVFGRKTAEIDNYPKPQKQVRNVGTKYHKRLNMTKGVIAAGDSYTAFAGAEILIMGGNAVDAAVAAAFASFVAEVGAIHLGGSGFAHIYDTQNGRSLVYDFFSAMPGLGSSKIKTKIDFDKVTIDFGNSQQDFYVGRGSFAVPGNIAGLCQMVIDHGRLSLEDVLRPAINLASNGVQLSQFQAEVCKLLSPIYSHTNEIRDIFFAKGDMKNINSHIVIPGLAETLTELKNKGVRCIRTGMLAQAIVADQVTNGGLITRTDLNTYNVYRRPSIRLAYHNYEILLPPPCSTGGILIGFSLKLMYKLRFDKLKYGSLRHLRLFYEVMYATREARSYWDQAIAKMATSLAIESFLADSFIDKFVEVIKTRAGNAKYSVRSNAFAAETSYRSNTSHLSVIDHDGLAVSLTTTAGESAGYVIPGTGFVPNNILGEADLNPNGFHAHPPGRRIPTMMAPTIVTHKGIPKLVVGSSGSTRIRSAIIQVVSNMLDFDFPVKESVDLNRYHLENDILHCESGFDEDSVAELEKLGYPIKRWNSKSMYFGGTHSASQTHEGILIGAGDIRRGGVTQIV